MPSPGENQVSAYQSLRDYFEERALERVGNGAWKIVVVAYEVMGSEYARAIINGWSEPLSKINPKESTGRTKIVQEA